MTFIKKPLVDHFDDASDTHQEVPGYTHCIRVHFTEPQEGFDELQDYYEQTAFIVVFGDLAPKSMLTDWRDDQELWLRYNIGESFNTLAPDTTLDDRRHLIAIADARELLDFNELELAEYLEHFEGYPKDDAGISACEREAFITNEGNQEKDENFSVWLPGMQEPWFFKTEDEAYIFFIANYHLFRYAFKVE